MVSLLLTLSRFQTLFWYFNCWLWTSTSWLGINLSHIQNNKETLTSFNNDFLLFIVYHWVRPVYPPVKYSMSHEVSYLKGQCFTLVMHILVIFQKKFIQIFVQSIKKQHDLKVFFSKCEQNGSFLGISSHLLKKFLMGNFHFLYSAKYLFHI